VNGLGERPGAAGPPGTFTAAETGDRAAGGAALLVARGAVILVAGVGANIVLARLLSPRDFGLVALGGVLIVFGSFFADAGLGAGLIRRAQPPTREELAAVNAVQFLVTGGLAAAAAGVAAVIGRDAWIVAAMVASLPIAMLKVPSVILLERRLEYRTISIVDLVEAGVFYAWALVTVALGAGVWGFATAVVARAAVGSATMLWLGPAGIVRPRWSGPAIRPLLGFGAKFQASVVIALVRDQTLNVGIAAIAGVSALGVWNLAWRVLQIPFMVFGTLGRVGFPAMARLLEDGSDPRPVLERGGAALAVLSAAMMVALTSFAPALPSVLGDSWHQVPAVLLWAGIALIASLPAVVSTMPYLFATDEGGTVVIAALIAAVLWLGLTFPLLVTLGPVAAAIGWCAGAFGQLALLVVRTGERSGAAIASSLAAPVLLGIAAAVLGWVIADAAGDSAGAGLLGVAAGEVLLLVALTAVGRAALRDTRAFLVQAIGNFGKKGVAATGRAGG
jgi:O-antigen/teichoic acid export membrane protein